MFHIIFSKYIMFIDILEAEVGMQGFYSGTRKILPSLCSLPHATWVTWDSS